MEVPGAFEPTSPSDLNTPIRNLRLGSPSSLSPIYPNLDDILPSSSPPLNSYMQSLGYLRKLSSNVLKELNQRATHIAAKLKSPPASATLSARSRLHRRDQLESISSHYLVSGANYGTCESTAAGRGSINDQHNQKNATHFNNSSLRCTSDSNTPAEYAQKHASKKRESIIEPVSSKRRRMANLAGESSALRLPLSPTKHSGVSRFGLQVPSLNSSPFKFEASSHPSPLKRISPSKKYNDLHSILTLEPEIDNQSPIKFPVPKAKGRTLSTRPSVLQLAGVKPLPAETTKHATIAGSPTSKTLNAAVSSRSDSSRSIPALKNSSLTHNNSKNKSTQSLHTLLKSHSNNTTAAHFAKPQKLSVPHIPASAPLHPPKVKLTRSPTSKSLKAPTVPQPFLLYDKPTISSSQKSLDRFNKFKSKFS